MQVKLDWEKYYEPFNEYINFDGIATKYHISECYFHDLENEDPSAINIKSTNDETKVLIESSSVIKCSSSSASTKGGAIYFGTKGNFVIQKVCAYNCHTSTNVYGQFLSSASSQGSSFVNSAFYCSVSQCGSSYSAADDVLDSEKRFAPFLFDFGKQEIENVNASQNRCWKNSAICLGGDNENIDIDCLVSFCNCVDNKDYNGHTLVFNHQRSYVCKMTNIIDNTAINAPLIWVYQSTTFSDCSFINNECKAIFQVFGESSTSVKVKQCFIGSNQDFASAELSETNVHEFTVKIRHFGTNKCHADFKIRKIPKCTFKKNRTSCNYLFMTTLMLVS